MNKHITAALLAVSLTLLSACGASSAPVQEAAGSANAVTAATGSAAVEVILNAGTTQAFTDEAVPAEEVETILRAGLAAESTINQQPWFFAAVTDKELLSELNASGGMPSFQQDGKMPSFARDGERPAMPEGMPAPSQGGERPAIPEVAKLPEGTERPEKPEGVKPSQGGERPAMPEGMPAPSQGGAKASLGDAPLAVIIYQDKSTSSPNSDFDCGLAAQNMYLAAVSLGYGAKIVSSPTMTLNGGNHDQICEKLGVDPSYTAVAVLLVGKADQSVDGVTGASVRAGLEEKTTIR